MPRHDQKSKGRHASSNDFRQKGKGKSQGMHPPGSGNVDVPVQTFNDGKQFKQFLGVSETSAYAYYPYYVMMPYGGPSQQPSQAMTKSREIQMTKPRQMHMQPTGHGGTTGAGRPHKKKMYRHQQKRPHHPADHHHHRQHRPKTGRAKRRVASLPADYRGSRPPGKSDMRDSRRSREVRDTDPRGKMLPTAQKQGCWPRCEPGAVKAGHRHGGHKKRDQRPSKSGGFCGRQSARETSPQSSSSGSSYDSELYSYGTGSTSYSGSYTESTASSYASLYHDHGKHAGYGHGNGHRHRGGRHRSSSDDYSHQYQYGAPMPKQRKKGGLFVCNAVFCGACDAPGGVCSWMNCGGCCDRSIIPPTGCCSRQKSFDSVQYREALSHKSRRCCCEVQ